MTQKFLIALLLVLITQFLVALTSDAASTDAPGGTPASADDQKRAHAKELVDKVNSKNKGCNLWKAEYKEHFALMEDAQRKRMANGVRRRAGKFTPDAAEKRTALPAGDDLTHQSANASSTDIGRRRRRQATCTNVVAFDARQRWPGCAGTIGKVEDQSQCGSCWAVSTASVFTDRMCIARTTAGLSTSATAAAQQFSALDLMSCATGTYGCDGGDPGAAWNWIKSTGMCTGTDYTWNSGCKPYPFEPNAWTSFTTPACASSCTNSAWTKSYTSDKKFASWVGYLEGPGHVTDIENEIKNYGSVVAVFDVYEEFYYYTSGVYKLTSSSGYVGPHAIRLIGWGTQSCSDGTNTPYWLAVNSWNTNWGEQGFFRIAKGVDELYIESWGIFFGDPVV